MTDTKKDKDIESLNIDYEKLRNSYISIIVVAFTFFCLLYLILKYFIIRAFIIHMPYEQDFITQYIFNEDYSIIHAEDIWLIAITLVANFGLTGKLRSFSINKLGFGVDFSEVKSEINQLQKDVEQLKDQLMTSAILDGYEFNTLKRLNDKNYGVKFEYNFLADLQLRHL